MVKNLKYQILNIDQMDIMIFIEQYIMDIREYEIQMIATIFVKNMENYIKKYYND
jgi:hypothetical protein